MPDYLLYRLDTLSPDVADVSLLTPEEKNVYGKRGWAYLAERCLLKREIGRRLGMAASEICLQIGEQGKPYFPGIHFNLSHSGSWLCLAFHHAPVGVDIERICPRKRFEGLAARIMVPEQWRLFRERGCSTEEFYACWCAAEALVKQAGSGIGHAKRFPFLYRDGGIHLLYPTESRVELFSPAPGYQGALAYASGGGQ